MGLVAKRVILHDVLMYISTPLNKNHVTSETSLFRTPRPSWQGHTDHNNTHYNDHYSCPYGNNNVEVQPLRHPWEVLVHRRVFLLGRCNGSYNIRCRLPFWCEFLPRSTQITTTAMIITRTAAATGTTRFRFERKMRIGELAPWSGISRAGAIVPVTPNQKKKMNVRSEVLAAGTVKITVLRYVMQCSPVEHYWYFKGKCCLHSQDRRTVEWGMR